MGTSEAVSLVFSSAPTIAPTCDFYHDDLQGFLELTSEKGVVSSQGTGKQSRKSRDTLSNKRVWPWNTKWSRAKTEVFLKECTGHSKHRLPTTQEMTLHMDITRWSLLKSDWLYSLKTKMEKLYTVHKKQQQELTVAQIMNSLLQNSDLNWRKWGKPPDHSGMS